MSNIRCTFTLPEELYQNICKISGSLGISKSALVALTLSDAVSLMVGVVSDFEEAGGTPEASLRLRGESVARVDAIYREFHGSLVNQDSVADKGAQ